MKRACRTRRPLVGVLCLCLLWTAPGRGDEPNNDAQEPVDPDAPKLAEAYIEQFEALERLQAEIQFLQAANERYKQWQAAGGAKLPLFQAMEKLDTTLKPQLATLVASNYKPYLDGIKNSGTTIENEVGQLRGHWTKLRTHLYDGRIKTFEAKAQKEVAAQLATLLNVNNRWLWMCGLLASGSLLGVYVFERRHRFRRMFWVRKQQLVVSSVVLLLLIAITLIPTGLTFLLGNKTYESLLALAAGQGASPKQKIETEVQTLREKVSQLKDEHQDLLQRYDGLRKSWGESASKSVPVQCQDVFEDWLPATDTLRHNTVNLSLQKKLALEIQKDLKEWEKVEAEHAEHAKSRKAAEQKKQLTAGVLGLVLFFGNFGAGLTLCRRIRRRREKVKNTCPRCGKKDSLEEFGDGGTDGSEGGLGVRELRCNNIVRQEPYEECEFQFPAAYCDRMKLGFPTLGVSSSGKTHWLAMAYRQLNQGNYPKKVEFQKLRTRGSDAFNSHVDRILNDRLDLSATLYGLPQPLIFAFRDKDRWGNSDILMSIFDYNGQVTTDEKGYYRRRALDADGFFFFLDPIKRSETQAEALLGFRQDLQLVKDVKTGRQLHTPVALCVSKLDLMVNEEYAKGADIIQRFYEDLREIDQSFDELSLELIQQRSQRTAELAPMIWPAWNIERQIGDFFGGRYMFFPMTPVGLDKPGVTNLRQRTIMPYAILEPLLWLLHMNGYPILD